MDMNEFKRELSKLSGVDFFNPKYRELFKKHFGEDRDAEGERLKEMGGVDEDGIAEKEEDVDKAEDEREIDKIEEEKADDPEKRDEKAEERREETHEIGKEVGELKDDERTDELLDAKIENALLRGGVREERFGAAMRLAKSEIESVEELDKVKDILKDFPEWVRGYNAKNFGMDVDEGGDNLTEEEKRLKAMGINPRD